MRPAQVIERLRDECPIFDRRVVGLIGRDKALDDVMGEQRGLAVPCCYVAWEGDTVGGEVSLTDLSDTVERSFSVFAVVSGVADASGQDASERLLDVLGELLPALVGWTPSTTFGALVFDGVPDPPIYNRAYGAVTFVFTGQYFTSAP